MPRTYNKELIELVQTFNPYLDTTCFAKACIKANLPSNYVASALEVSRMSIHNWFRGSPIRENNRKLVEVFTDLVESDTAKGILPAKNHTEARKYLEDMVGRKI